MKASPKRRAYPSDLTNSQWETLRERLPVPKVGPQETLHDRREIINAMLYQKRTGCQWRFLPHDLPPWSAVKKWFDKAASDTGLRVDVVKRSDGAKGFEVLPKRWVVERSLGWLNRDRRLSKDYERTVRSGESWVWLAFVERLLRRLA